MVDDEREKESKEQLVLRPGESEIRDRIEALRVEQGYPPLPNVTIVVGPRNREWPHYTREQATILLDNEPVGFCDFITLDDTPEYAAEPPARLHFDNVSTRRLRGQSKDDEVPRDSVPRGVGLATYLLAIELANKRGIPFVSQSSLNDDSERMWALLSETGLVLHRTESKHGFPRYVIPPDGQSFDPKQWGVQAQ